MENYLKLITKSLTYMQFNRKGHVSPFMNNLSKAATRKRKKKGATNRSVYLYELEKGTLTKTA